jgi:hypothetical protein
MSFISLKLAKCKLAQTDGNITNSSEYQEFHRLRRVHRQSFKRGIGTFAGACRTVTRVSVPFTEGHYHGEGKRPNTELARNSPFACRNSSKLNWDSEDIELL